MSLRRKKTKVKTVFLGPNDIYTTIDFDRGMISNALQNLACPNGVEQEDWITSNSKLLFEFHQKNRSIKR